MFQVGEVIEYFEEMYANGIITNYHYDKKTNTLSVQLILEIKQELELTIKITKGELNG